MTRRLVVGIGRPFEDSAGDHLAQPVGKDVARNAEAGLEFLEMVKAVEGAAKDQERPFLADQLDRGGNRARQRRFLEPIDIRRERVCRHCLYLPCRISSKHTTVPKNSCECETDRVNQLQIATITGGLR